jgi:hypothetical protein
MIEWFDLQHTDQLISNPSTETVSTNAVKKFGNTMRKRKYADKDHADQELSDGTTVKKARVV